MTPDLNGTMWRKSSYSSGQGGECVELSLSLSAIRDSKDPTGPALIVDLRGFLAAVKSGRLDR